MSDSTYGTYARVQSFTAKMNPGQNGLVTVMVEIKNFHSRPGHSFHCEYLPPIATEALRSWLETNAEENAQIKVLRNTLKETRAALDKMCKHAVLDEDTDGNVLCIACGVRVSK